MKKFYINIILLFIFVASCSKKYEVSPYSTDYIPIIEPVYDNVWGTIYNAKKRQCDNNPTITGDGSRIDIKNASNLRWIAISQEMLNCRYRQKLMNDSTSTLYKGKLHYGDTVWIQSSNENINGWWIVHDTKNKRYVKSIDFLQTKGDGSLYDNNPDWDGKFREIKIYKVKIITVGNI
ncbi:MAG: hypothetical protein PF487_09775 [Bacteroidales bacterium]|jgi:hypothetical protein|nr:hypothetical protein [Bacteroidales bacterium]